VLELGCGTGRVTHVLADRYARVLAVDVSPGNLRLCQEKLIQMGKTNVECLLLKCPRDIENILPVDLFFSTIVLQHNPPPVIHYFLDQIFGKIREGGSVIFQVPTDRAGYSFNVIDYLASPAPAMEMHALPMRAIFSLFAKHRLRPLEVLMDGWTASLGSHMFFAVRD
jgi:cyclopropane fatty-acyl-phospholipid synthase-like methyltransferase